MIRINLLPAAQTQKHQSVQQQLLIDTLQQEAEIEPLVAGMIGAWFSGDDALFMEMFEAQSGDSELTRQFTEQLLDHR